MFFPRRQVKKVIKRIWKYDKRLSCFIINYILCSIGIMLTSFVGPMADQLYIDNIVDAPSFQNLLCIIVIIISAAFWGFFLSLYCNYVEQNEYKVLRLNIQKDIFSKVLYTKKKIKISDAKDKIENEIYYFIFKNISLGRISTAISVLGYLAIMAYVNFKLLLVAVIIIPTTKLILNLANKHMIVISKEYRQKYTEYEGWLLGILSAWRTIKLDSGESAVEDRYLEFWGELSALYRRRQKAFIMQYCVQQFKDIVLVKMGLYLLGIWLVGQGSITPGHLIAFIQYYDSLVSSMEKIDRYNIEEKAYSAYINSADDLLDQMIERKSDTNAINGVCSISLKNINYSIDDINIIRIENLSIQPHETLFLSGESGSGKTTLLNLLAGLILDYQGEIRISGFNIQELNYGELSALRGMVSQNYKLFKMSIKENMLLAKANASEAEIIDCCQQAACMEFILNLPKGLDTIVDNNLSAGQIQRLCIARLLLQDPQIVLLDEPFSALDPQNIERIKHMIESDFCSKIVVVASHISDTFENAKIYSL